MLAEPVGMGNGDCALVLSPILSFYLPDRYAPTTAGENMVGSDRATCGTLRTSTAFSREEILVATAMSLRASLEAVLRKHAFFPLSKLRQTEQPSAYFVPSIDTLLDDLLAMFPHPSREALEQLLLQRDIVDRE